MKTDKWHLNRRNVTVRVPTRLFFVDTEAKEKNISNDEKKQTLRLGSAVRWERHEDKEGKGLEWITFRKAEDFWCWLDERIKQRTKVYLFAHNWRYDYRALDGDTHLLDLGWDLNNPIRGGNVWLDYWTKENKTLVVTDTFNLFRRGVESIGKSLGLPKLKVDPLKVPDNEVIPYCQRDVEIIYEAVKRLIDTLKREKLGSFAPTVGGLAYNIYTHTFQGTPYLVHKHKWSMDLERESYRGGWTDCFYLGDTENDEVYYLDVQSMYPSVMYKNEYPYEWLDYNRWKDLEELEDLLKDHCITARVGVELNKRGIGVKKERLIFPIGKFEAVLTTPELRYVMENGEIHYVREFVCYKQAELFNDFIEYFWDKRKRAIEEGDETTKMFQKLIMNNLYGKLGEREYITEFVGYADPYFEDYYIPEDDMEEGVTYNCYKFADKIWKTRKGAAKEQSLVAIPSHVTAYGRVKLGKLIEKAGEENVYYTDTDSLFVNRKGYRNLNGEIEEGKLGKLRIKGVNRLIVNNVKDYYFGDQRYIKGVKKNATEIEKGKFEQWLPEGYITATKEGRTAEVRLQCKHKVMERIYKKGYGKERERTRPFTLSEF